MVKKNEPPKGHIPEGAIGTVTSGGMMGLAAGAAAGIPAGPAGIAVAAVVGAVAGALAAEAAVESIVHEDDKAHKLSKDQIDKEHAKKNTHS